MSLRGVSLAPGENELGNFLGVPAGLRERSFLSLLPSTVRKGGELCWAIFGRPYGTEGRSGARGGDFGGWHGFGGGLFVAEAEPEDEEDDGCA
jgi:hypothetical protein